MIQLMDERSDDMEVEAAVQLRAKLRFEGDFSAADALRSKVVKLIVEHQY